MDIVTSDYNVEEIVKTYYKKELKKIFKKSLGLKKQSREKGINYSDNLKKYKINDNPNTFILLRLYYYNQQNKISQDGKYSHISTSIKPIFKKYKI